MRLMIQILQKHRRSHYRENLRPRYRRLFYDYNGEMKEIKKHSSISDTYLPYLVSYLASRRGNLLEREKRFEYRIPS